MNLFELKKILAENQEKTIKILLPNHGFVPAHFHITEIGKVTKDFIDCGGTQRSTESCVLQAWTADDLEHRLSISKLLTIIEIGSSMFDINKLPIEVEYSDEFISQYPLVDVVDCQGELCFILGKKETACLAPDKCGVKKKCCGGKSKCC